MSENNRIHKCAYCGRQELESSMIQSCTLGEPGYPRPWFCNTMDLQLAQYESGRENAFVGGFPVYLYCLKEFHPVFYLRRYGTGQKSVQERRKLHYVVGENEFGDEQNSI